MIAWLRKRINPQDSMTPKLIYLKESKSENKNSYKKLWDLMEV